MDMRLPGPGEAVAVIAKLPGEICNLNCHYCFERRKPYPGATFLTAAVLRRFLAIAAGRPLAVTLHGGEPLIVGQAAMLPLLHELRGYAGPVKLGMQTNGLLLDGAWLDLFEREWPGLTLGISLDGDEAANGHRVDHRDRSTFDGVVDALRLLSERHWTVGLIMVVTRRALGRAETILQTFARHPCVRLVKLASCLDYAVTSRRYGSPSGRTMIALNPVGVGVPGWATTPSQYVEFVEQAATYWRAAGLYRNFLLEPVVSIVRAIDGKPTEFTEFSDRKEPFIVTLYPDGRVGSSDHFGMPQALLGHVDEVDDLSQLLDLRTNPALRDRLDALTRSCDGCTHQATCRGGSLADRLRYHTPELASGYCDARRRLIDFVGSRLLATG
jgi:radical SAM protein with 4Fe4S-binding SPASM domain